ncbi:MAG: thioredoxin family protein [Planctomycetes bacterium]|nr:thioredoxin family protein [Planctomycetota bacterium]
MIDPASLRVKHAAGATYDDYVRSSPQHEAGWRAVEGRVQLSEAQRALVGGFTRRINVICLSGMWCGDCSAQGPLLHAIATASPMIDLRWLDRDAHADLSEQVRICGGLRVPTVIFANEDFEFLSLLGDRTLTRYRAIAARALGASCPLPGARVADDELAATIQDWVDEFERAHLIARLSPRLRGKHGD